MNNLSAWRQKLIALIAGNEPVILNMCFLACRKLPDGMDAICIIPSDGEIKTAEEWGRLTFVVPMRNVKSEAK